MRHRFIQLAAAATLSACAPPVPPLAVGVSGHVEFNERVKARFPVGSDARELRTELRTQGFQIGDSHWAGFMFSAHYVGGGFPCNSNVSVNWNESSDRITRISSNFGGACL
jgi:hypothetical protein